MIDDDFMQLVSDMRDAQKDYFAYRFQKSLEQSRRLEKEVDNAIRDWKMGIEPKQQQRRLQ